MQYQNIFSTETATHWGKDEVGELTYGGFPIDIRIPFVTSEYHFVFGPINCRKEVYDEACSDTRKPSC